MLLKLQTMYRLVRTRWVGELVGELVRLWKIRLWCSLRYNPGRKEKLQSEKCVTLPRLEPCILRIRVYRFIMLPLGHPVSYN